MQASIGNWTISVERTAYTPDDLTYKYDELSPEWDQTLARLGFDKAYDGLFQDMTLSGQLNHLSPNARVFDAGIGTGALSFALATNRDAPLAIHGIDISSKMLNQARRNLKQVGLNSTLRVGDACQLPYSDNHFDWVMTAHMLEHLDNPHAGVQELVRVTKSGGTVLIVMTRKSLIGQYIDLQWRLNRISEETLICWMANLGLQNIQPLRFKTPVWANWMSMIYIATKS